MYTGCLFDSSLISGIAVDFHGKSQAHTLHKALTDAFRISYALLIIIGGIFFSFAYIISTDR
jgi:hypothetical protein